MGSYSHNWHQRGASVQVRPFVGFEEALLSIYIKVLSFRFHHSLLCVWENGHVLREKASTGSRPLYLTLLLWIKGLRVLSNISFLHGVLLVISLKGFLSFWVSLFWMVFTLIGVLPLLGGFELISTIYGLFGYFKAEMMCFGVWLKRMETSNVDLKIQGRRKMMLMWHCCGHPLSNPGSCSDHIQSWVLWTYLGNSYYNVKVSALDHGTYDPCNLFGDCGLMILATMLEVEGLMILASPLGDPVIDDPRESFWR